MKTKEQLLKAAQDVYDWLYLYHPEAIKYVVDDEILKKVALYLETEKYDTLLFTLGILSYLAVIQYFTENEEYEKCQKMIDVIYRWNNKYDMELPTDYYNEQIQEWTRMSVSEFIQLVIK